MFYNTTYHLNQRKPNLYDIGQTEISIVIQIII